MRPTEIKTTKHIPDDVYVTKPVNIQLLRNRNQPSPSDFAVSMEHGQMSSRSRPYGVLQRMMHIPKTRGLSETVLWEERCSVLPHHQEWGMAWVFFIPDHPGITFKKIQVVFLGCYRTEGAAVSAQNRVRGMFPNRASILFRIGHWTTLPIPRWLTGFQNIDRYNGDIIKRLMKQDFRKTQIEHEILRRRTNAKTNKQHEDPQVATQKVEDVVYGTTQAAEEEVAQQPRTARLEVDDWNADDVKPILRAKQKYGLAWVLPAIQNEGRDLKEIAIAWLGTFKSLTEVNSQQELIRTAHPEWDVHRFDVGQPLDLPVPIWTLQANQSVHYSQDTLRQFMRTDTAPTEVAAPLIEPPPLDPGESTKRVVFDIAAEEEEVIKAIAGAGDTDEEEEKEKKLLLDHEETTINKSGFKVTLQSFRNEEDQPLQRAHGDEEPSGSHSEAVVDALPNPRPS